MKARSAIPREILTAGMYYQARGCDPVFDILEGGQERIELVLAGRGWLRDRQKLIEMRPGHLLWHVAGEETISKSDWQNPYVCLCLKLQVRVGEQRAHPRISMWKGLEAARAFSEQVIRWNADESVNREGLMHYLMGSILLHAAQGVQTSVQQPPVSLGKALQLIQDRCCDKTDIPGIAREVGLSISHLHALFRRHLNESPHQILLRCRLRVAKEKLASTDDTMKQIAFECGFATPAAFSHTFKTHVGESPLAYRIHQTGH